MVFFFTVHLVKGTDQAYHCCKVRSRALEFERHRLYAVDSARDAMEGYS
jgi:hypothetical protein